MVRGSLIGGELEEDFQIKSGLACNAGRGVGVSALGGRCVFALEVADAAEVSHLEAECPWGSPAVLAVEIAVGEIRRSQFDESGRRRWRGSRITER